MNSKKKEEELNLAIDSLFEELNKIASEYDPYVYSLPTHHQPSLKKMRREVRNFLENIILEGLD
jgi:hypothetical protein